MKVNIISRDQLWLDSLRVSLGFLLEYDIQSYNHISVSFENMVEQSESNSVLLVDSNIPGVDYWALLEWLRRTYQGRTIVLKDSWSYNLCAEKMIRNGCYAVLDKRLGFVAFWRALNSAIEGQQFQSEDDVSLFSPLSVSEQILASDLVSNSIGSLSKSQGISQQAMNKRKLSIYRKLNLSTVSPDKPFQLLAKLFN